MTVDTSKIPAWNEKEAAAHDVFIFGWDHTRSLDELIAGFLETDDARGLRMYACVKAALERRYERTGPHASSRSEWMWREFHRDRKEIGHVVFELLSGSDD